MRCACRHVGVCVHVYVNMCVLVCVYVTVSICEQVCVYVYVSMHVCMLCRYFRIMCYLTRQCCMQHSRSGRPSSPRLHSPSPLSGPPTVYTALSPSPSTHPPAPAEGKGVRWVEGGRQRGVTKCARAQVWVHVFILAQATTIDSTK